jgi:site-specific recombinase XerD
MDKDEALHQFEQYLQRRFPDRRTAKDYLSDLRQFTAICQKAWRDIRMHDIDHFVDQQRAQGLKPATVNRRVAALKTFFDFLAEENDDLSWPNPVRFKRHAGKRERRLPRDLHDEDLEQIWTAISSARDRAWFVLMVRAGLRVGEVVALKIDDLLSPPHGEQPARLRVSGKGCKERIVLLSADAYAILETWLAERTSRSNSQIFLNERGKALASSGIQWLLHGYGRSVGIDLTPHQLRHTFARQVTEAGMPITSLGKLLGHSQITTTQIYTAGADPGLSQAYQAAMHQLESGASVPSTQFMPATTLSNAPQPTAPPEPKELDWDTWEQELPPAIRQASIAYVKRLYFNWPVRTRRPQALNALHELARLWHWLLARRPFTLPGEVSFKELRAYQTDQQAAGYTASTINRRIDFLMGVARQLADQEEPVDNSIFRLRYLRRPDSLPKHLTEAESQRLEAFLHSELEQPDYDRRRVAACTLLMLHSGLRSGECVALSFQDLDLSARRLIVRQGKGRRDRLVYLSEATCQAIQAYLQDPARLPTDPLWVSRHHRPWSQTNLQKRVARLGQAIGIDHLYPHRLRHTCATRLLNAGMDITRIQKLLGHEMISTTMIYARVEDATVENDYRQTLRKIEQRQIPFSEVPVPAVDWPTQVFNVQETLDNSV